MIKKIKKFFTLGIRLGIIDKNIYEAKYDLALSKLNTLVEKGYKDEEVMLKRGKLCKQLFMPEEAYEDFSYIIKHCANKTRAYSERMLINFEIGNFYEAITDSTRVLTSEPENKNAQRIKTLSLIFSSQEDSAISYTMDLYQNNKFKIIQFIFKEASDYIKENEFAKALKLLAVVDRIDENNPLKLYNEANVYALAGDVEKQKNILQKIDSVFPKYFISHFHFTDIFQDRNFLEVCFLLELNMFDTHNLFTYQFLILQGYKNQMEGHIIDSKENFEKAIKTNPNKPDAYVLLAQTLQLMSGYNNKEYREDAEKNYKIAMELYAKDNLQSKVEDMKRQIKHLTSSISII